MKFITLAASWKGRLLKMIDSIIKPLVQRSYPETIDVITKSDREVWSIAAYQLGWIWEHILIYVSYFI